MSRSNININSPATVRELGLQALKDALGPVGMVRFMQQFEDGRGDYTAEKYDMPEEDIDVIIKELKEMS